ncbi:hypothetical protein [Fulvimarina sp. MAC8]|uniref:hypothetical protein n=1 Tax=Fulvimarina sp. MAC8 TaxID=3162874 RepID=UPI0032EF1EEF
MTTDLDLYGTSEPVAPVEIVRIGSVAFELQDGAVSYLSVDGHELIRRIGFLARDRDWGTLFPAVETVERIENGNNFRLHTKLIFENDGACLRVDLRLSVDASGAVFEATGHARGAFETNRTGFTVLHPIAGQQGAPIEVVHSDGRTENSEFPERIAPWQPFMDIAAITHQVGDITCTCRFEGDVFEMEDHRQWGDASFKTYNRPLARPWPYQIADGETVRQTLRLHWKRTNETAQREPASNPATPKFPQTAVLLTADHARRAVGHLAHLEFVLPQRLLCHVDATLGDVAGQFAAFAELQKAAGVFVYDLELIGDFGSDPTIDPAAPLQHYADAMRWAGFVADSVMLCPAVDRQSTPPGSEWPPCPPLDAIHDAARKAFACPIMGGGMASFFPELNRKRPPIGMLDFVSHSLCPIIHDASDRSIMEMFEAIPHIATSARAFLGGADYRIGPSTIAMRQNPYGSRTISNPDGRRIAMAHDDPRHRARYGAAYTLGLAAALAPAGVTVWTPAELYGPRGLFGDDGHPHPLTEVVARLARQAGKTVLSSSTTSGEAELRFADLRFQANLTHRRQNGLNPYEWLCEERETD